MNNDNISRRKIAKLLAQAASVKSGFQFLSGKISITQVPVLYPDPAALYRGAFEARSEGMRCFLGEGVSVDGQAVSHVDFYKEKLEGTWEAEGLTCSNEWSDRVQSGLAFAKEWAARQPEKYAPPVLVRFPELGMEAALLKGARNVFIPVNEFGMRSGEPFQPEAHYLRRVNKAYGELPRGHKAGPSISTPGR